MTEKTKYRVGAYLRLSKGDGDVDGMEKSESNSISNQRLIIDRFLKEYEGADLSNEFQMEQERKIRRQVTCHFQ